MKHILILLNIFVFVFSFGLSAQQQTADGGYVIAGSGNSFTHGMHDLFVFKLDATGKKQWRKNYGGLQDELSGFVKQTADGGYILCGCSFSYTNGSSDILVYKLNATGAKQWRKNYGGDMMEMLYGVIQTADTGYAVSGTSSSYTSDGNRDFIVYKLDASGAKQWRKTYGGEYFDSRPYIQQTTDGGYILGGSTQTYTHGGVDFLAYKLDAAGKKQWRRNYGGTGADEGRVIRQTADGGYVFAGYGESYPTMPNAEVPVPAIPGDMLVYKLNAAGMKQWRKNLGGSKIDKIEDIWQTSDGGYLVTGYSTSFSGGCYDYLIFKLDATGAKQWRKTYGGDKTDYASFGFQTSDGGYLIYGDSYSYSNTGSDRDVLVYKVDATGKKQWRKNYGGSGYEDVPGGGC